MSYFAQLFRGKLKREFSHVWNELVSCAADLHPGELMADIEQAYEEGLVEAGYVGWGEVKRDFEGGKDRMLARLAEDSNRRLVEDTVREMEGWACFEEERGWNEPAPASAAFKRETPKTGRNDPCPCGSGKKFKKCCGA